MDRNGVACGLIYSEEKLKCKSPHVGVGLVLCQVTIWRVRNEVNPDPQYVTMSLLLIKKIFPVFITTFVLFVFLHVLRRRDLGRKVAFRDFHGPTVLGSIDERWHLSKNTEHQ